MEFTTWPINSCSKLRLGIVFSISKFIIEISHELNFQTYGVKSKFMLIDREKSLQVCETEAASLLLLVLCTSFVPSASDLNRGG